MSSTGGDGGDDGGPCEYHLGDDFDDFDEDPEAEAEAEAASYYAYYYQQQQQQQMAMMAAAPPEEEEEEDELNPLEMLSAVFEGHFDTDTLVEALRVNGLDFDAAYEFLCELDPSAAAAAAGAPRAAIGPPPPRLTESFAAVATKAPAPTQPTALTSKLGYSAPPFVPRAIPQQKQQPPQPQQQPQQKQPADTTQVCTFWLAGQCRVKNCPFLHTTIGVPCRYFAQGYCANADACLFMHTDAAEQQQRLARIAGGAETRGTYRGDLWIPPSSGGDSPAASVAAAALHQSAPPAAAPAPAPRQADFPPLGAAETKAPTTEVSATEEEPAVLPAAAVEDAAEEEEKEEEEDEELGPDRVKPLTAAERVKLGELVRHYWWVPKPIVETVFRESNQDAANAVKVLTGTYGFKAPEGMTPPPPATAAPAGATTAEESTEESRTKAKAARRKLREKGTAGWVATGDAVSKLYEQTRAEAIMHAQMRNFHFRVATQLFLAGKHAEAKEHSRQGHYHDECMRRLHERAAEKIVQERNPRFKDMTDDVGEQVLDLHGLHMREAIDLLHGILINTKSSHPRVVYAITGTGHHTADGKAKLAKVVVDFLEKNKLNYYDCSVDKSGGMFRIIVPASTPSS